MQTGSGKKAQLGEISRQGRGGSIGAAGIVMVAIAAAGCGWIVGRLQTAPAASVAEPDGGTESAALATRHIATHVPVADVDHRAAAAIPAASDAGGGNPPGGLDPELLAASLAGGTDAQRLAALTTALEYDVELPAERLIAAYEHDASDQVRLLAFTTYVDTLATQVDAARAAMQAATGNTSDVVRMEAARRLAELAAYEVQMTLAPTGLEIKP